LDETVRVMVPGGKICASFRADNWQTRWTDWLTERRRSKQFGPSTATVFHKLNLTKDELVRMFRAHGFAPETVIPVENMPILYKFRFFRAASHKDFDENKGRKEGYRLSRLGTFLQNTFIRLFPDQFCNVYVFIGTKTR
jgi:hypothetical protein